MVVDCSQVVFLDSAGLRSLLRLADQAEVRGAQFRLAAVSPAVRRVLEVAGVDRVFAGPEDGASAGTAL